MPLLLAVGLDRSVLVDEILLALDQHALPRVRDLLARLLLAVGFDRSVLVQQVNSTRRLGKVGLAPASRRLVVTLSVFSPVSKADTSSLWWKFHRLTLRHVRGRLLDFNV